jgi:two-component system sensor histidine kinase KdpD
VEELLGSGIDVYTTMSVQHLASLNDVVAEITGIPEPDTVPDTFFDTADETVMVDMSADELLVRVKSGQVPIEHVVQGPKKHFFQKGNLLALREIALRRVADVVEGRGAPLPHREAHRGDLEDARTAALLHRARARRRARGAQRRAPRRPAGRALDRGIRRDAATAAPARAGARAHPAGGEPRREMGADTAILTGNDVVDAVVEYASDQNISTVVMGRDTPRRIRFGRTMSDAIATASERFDVIEIGHGGSDGGTVVTAPTFKAPVDTGPRRAEKRMRYLWTLLACAFTTLVLVLLAPGFDLANVAMLYMLTVLLAGVQWGRGPAIVAAILNVIAFDFFFVPPRYHLIPSRYPVLPHFRRDAGVGIVIGQLAGGIRFQAQVASHREKRARTLYEFARDLAQFQTTSEVIRHTEDFMGRKFRARVSVLVPDAAGTLVSPTSHGMTNPSTAPRRNGRSNSRAPRAPAPTRSAPTSTCSCRSSRPCARAACSRYAPSARATS